MAPSGIDSLPSPSLSWISVKVDTRPLRCSQILQQSVRELPDRLENNQESAGGASLLFFLPADPGGGNEPGRRPSAEGILSNLVGPRATPTARSRRLSDRLTRPHAHETTEL